MVLPRRLDRALQRLGAGIGEEDDVGEGQVGQALRQPLTLGDLVDVGRVPELLGLVRQRLDEMRVRMTDRGDRDAAAEVEISLAIRREEPDSFATLEKRAWRGRRSASSRRSRAVPFSSRLAFETKTAAQWWTAREHYRFCRPRCQRKRKRRRWAAGTFPASVFPRELAKYTAANRCRIAADSPDKLMSQALHRVASCR